VPEGAGAAFQDIDDAADALLDAERCGAPEEPST
jgi:hypothetical protein